MIAVSKDTPFRRGNVQCNRRRRSWSDFGHSARFGSPDGLRCVRSALPASVSPLPASSSSFSVFFYASPYQFLDLPLDYFLVQCYNLSDMVLRLLRMFVLQLYSISCLNTMSIPFCATYCTLIFYASPYQFLDLPLDYVPRSVLQSLRHGPQLLRMFVLQLYSISCLNTMSIPFCATYCTLIQSGCLRRSILPRLNISRECMRMSLNSCTNHTKR